MKNPLNTKEEQEGRKNKEDSEAQHSLNLYSGQVLGDNPFNPQGGSGGNPFNTTNQNSIQAKARNPFLSPVQKKEESNAKGTETIQRSDDDVSQHDLNAQRDRVRLANYVINAFAPITLAVRALGFEVSGAAVGFRESATAAAGVSGSVGVDEMLLFDIANMDFTGDVVPFAELGVGLQEGASFGVVFGLRLSPSGNYGNIRGAYAGPALNAQLQAVAGLGFSISPALFSGEEGFVATCFSLGAEAGGNVSVSYALSSGEIMASIGEVVNAGVNTLVGGINSAVSAMEGVGGAVNSILGEIIALPILTSRARLDPGNWNLSALPSRASAHLQAIGLYASALLNARDVNHYLSNLNKPFSDSIYNIPPVLVRELAEDLTRIVRARGGLFAGMTFSPELIMRQRPLELVELLEGYNLLGFRRSPEEIAREQMERQPNQ